MKKFVAFVVSFAGALFAFWVSTYGAYKIFLESKWFGFGNGISLLLGYLVGVVISVMVWFGWHDMIFSRWTNEK